MNPARSLQHQAARIFPLHPEMPTGKAAGQHPFVPARWPGGEGIGNGIRPRGEFTSRHQMTVNRKRDGITADDFIAVARRQGLNVAAAKRKIDAVRAALGNWDEYADKATVDPEKRSAIGRLIVP